MQRKRKNNRLAGVCIVLLTAVVVVVGLAVGRRKQAIQKAEESGFVTSSAREETQALGKFDNFYPTVPIEYDAQSEAAPAFPNTTNSAAGTVSDPTATIFASTTNTAAGTSAGTTVHSYGTGEDYAYAYAGFTPQAANMDVDYTLLLVNRNYILPQDYSPELAEAVKGSGVRMDARVAPYYQKMYDAAKADGITLTPLSGHRRISTQKTNFENKIQKYVNQGYSKAEATQMAAKIILPPGTSEHNAGIAMDIISLDVEFEQTQAFRWLQENAADYGFILRYPKDKQDITEITYEPWHWRYVGVENAKKIKASGQCLEEYLGVR
ncbi:MAG: D-alanyl-D-alanine carboxypeptidase family protein [Acutalibacteraceae bacterium]